MAGLFVVCALLAFPCQTAASGRDEKTAPSVITSAKLLADVDFLERVYEAAHPGLYRYNTKSEMDRYDRFQRYTRYRSWPLPKSFDGALDTWDWSFKDWGQAAKDDRDGFFRMARFDDDEKGDVITPRGRRYQGRVIVLIDASNSSATFQFAQVIKENKLATLVGQTTGGNQRGINGGAFFFVTLPNSRVEVDLPLVGNFVGDERPTGTKIPFREILDAGIDPDVAVAPSAADIAKGNDVELAAARVLLANPD
jgi:hypothetical protein